MPMFIQCQIHVYLLMYNKPQYSVCSRNGRQMYMHSYKVLLEYIPPVNLVGSDDKYTCIGLPKIGTTVSAMMFEC